ncbi:MAG: O-antigen ligase family protein, partial [Oscillochloris sp.]|nr:O-antigen ligase family protein [Oscillochloris sp.]
MQRETTLSRWCARIIEACWVLALTLIPIYFNLFTARHFEPDKATTLRTLMVIAATFGIIRGIEALNNRSSTPPRPQESASFWQRLIGVPLLLPTLVYTLVFLFTTVTSVVPATSFWGSYQRMQGTYTNLSYILLFVMILVTLRTRDQLERIVTISLIVGATVASYGVLQHFQLDPLPWKGDVIARVASTLGNSIFVAAYLILVVPLAFYRSITHLSASRAALPSERPPQDWLWACSRLLLMLCGMLLLLSVIKFGAAVRTVDTRYWWVFPAAVVSATAFWWLLTIDAGRGRTPLWPAFVMVGFLLLFSGQFVTTQLYVTQVIASAVNAPNAADWWVWLLVSLACGVAGYAIALLLPMRPALPSRLSLLISGISSGAAAVLMIVAVIFTQSRGPFLGLGAGIVVFFTLLLWAAQRHLKARGQVQLTKRLRMLLISWVTVATLAAAFLITFNLVDAPIFTRLREVPYIGRMGKLLEVNSGTGLVRRLIWTGDTYGSGAVGLITSNPLRTLIGWGPESMFVAYNPFFPPSLAEIEARGASPDRSHMAYLDELVTKGLIGLFSYLFLIISFIVLAIRLMLRSNEWNQQMFYITTLSIVVCHAMEGVTGIPIVASLMMLWVTLAITVAAGALDGHYQLKLRSETALAAPEATAAPAERKRRNAPARGGGRANAASHSPNRSESRIPALLAYAALLLVAFWFTWTANIAPVFADMRFQ